VIDFIKFRHDVSHEAPPLILLYRYVISWFVLFKLDVFFFRPGHYDILVQAHGK
jgi:hypothetical protein